MCDQVDIAVSSLSLFRMPPIEMRQPLQRPQPSYHKLVTWLPGVVCELAPDGTILFVNDAITAATGYPPSHLLGRNWWLLFFPDEQFRQVEDLFLRLRAGNVRDHMMQLTTSDGSIRVLNWHYCVDHRPDGTIDGILGFGVDVTTRRQAEEALRETECKLRGFIEHSHDGIAVVDERGAITEWNPSQEHITGLPRAAVLGRPLWEIQSRLAGNQTVGFQASLKHSVQQFLDSGLPPHFPQRHQWPICCPDGTQRTVQASTFPVKTDKGFMLGSIVRDVTPQQQAEQALRESEARFRKVFEEGPLAMAIVGLDYRIIKANSMFCQMLGYTEQEFTALTFAEITHPDDLEKDFELIHRLTAGEISQYTREKRYVTKQKQIKWVSVTASIVRDPAGVPLHFLPMVQDIGHRKEAEHSIKQSVDELRRTLEGTIHAMAAIVELRDPYTAGHQHRVAALARAIAEEMGLSEAQVDGVYLGAVVHDIGKICVPAEILSKPGRLHAMELGLISAHSQVGHDILQNIEFPWPIARIVLQHHERIDGSGYPSGLRGDVLLTEARILAVADVVEAMASHRPYRPALGIDQALQEISRHAGTKYDSAVVAACLHLLQDQGFQWR